jgi:hypothetical protein
VNRHGHVAAVVMLMSRSFAKIHGIDDDKKFDVTVAVVGHGHG